MTDIELANMRSAISRLIADTMKINARSWWLQAAMASAVVLAVLMLAKLYV